MMDMTSSFQVAKRKWLWGRIFNDIAWVLPSQFIEVVTRTELNKAPDVLCILRHERDFLGGAPHGRHAHQISQCSVKLASVP